ncbi:3'(2'),5'-bisphosphate nucleotidase [Balnearium lithotrophicum]|uniref:3'(2'),5'-bisphosphate nucleotidase CysQ n=1 Tax=Balnearium lithotrophicum TaxID=223788 RepID=A0A521C8D5_9BACT|nr:3'(2'),5'-bisphosphate nucleotidase CysQ [Balnearium lithotrophicum]SMO55699.1 3'(2'),5'-bisphosphate nucleotidase [Balnearium lithotrophicum]
MNSNLFEKLISIIKFAGNAILDIYNSNLDIKYKEDKSPLTDADRRAHKIIEEGLRSFSDYPILSEEGKNISFKKRKNWKYFWLVDPLDGTKEFIKRNDEFTVNIALIYKDQPILGIVYAPAKSIIYYGSKESGAFKIENEKNIKLNLKNNPVKDHLAVVSSKSHLNEETKDFIRFLENYYDKIRTVSIGSSLKICLVAEGKADIYPRLAPTMEWDTAAAHAVLKAAGGRIVKYSKTKDLKDLNKLPELEYNKPNLINPYFIALRPNVF